MSELSRFRGWVAAGALLWSLLPVPVIAAPITLGPSPKPVWLESGLVVPFNGGINDDQTYVYNPLPSTGVLGVSDAYDSGSLAYELTNDAFSIQFEGSRSGDVGSFVTHSFRARFIPDVDIDFAFSGIVSTLDPDGERVALQFDLWDYTGTAERLFSRTWTSDGVPDASLEILPVASYLDGQLSGRLERGHEYYFSFYANFGGADPSPSASSASGSFSFDFIPIPEPGTGTLVMCGLLLVARHRRETRTV